VLLVAAPAPAQPKGSALARARVLFDEAGELERQGQWRAAQDRLRGALRIRETPNLHYALAWALENDDKLSEARTEYVVALRLAHHAGNEEVRKLASTRIAEVDRETPLVRVRFEGPIAPDTRVFVDGREVLLRGDSGTLPVDPGSRVVRVERVGQPATEQRVSVARGVLRVVAVNGDDRTSLTDEIRAPKDGATTDARPILPWLLAAGGSVLAASGVLLLVSSSGEASARDDNTKPVVGGTLGSVGAIGIGVGVYLLLSRGAQGEPAKASRSSGLRIDVSPRAGGGTASASFAF